MKPQTRAENERMTARVTLIAAAGATSIIAMFLRAAPNNGNTLCARLRINAVINAK